MGAQLQPIRDAEKVHDVTVALSRLDGFRGNRMFLLWVVGINLGLRIGDLIDLKVGDVRDAAVYTYMPHKQARKKGAHKITIPIPKEVRKVVRARCRDMPADAWLFPSRKKTAAGKRQKPITRQTALADMREIGRIGGIEQRIGCHTMRKTFGYHYYQRHKDIGILQEWFYHTSPSTTLIYIGVALENFEGMVRKNPFDDMDGVRL